MIGILKLKMSIENKYKTPTVFPKLFIGSAYDAFKKYLSKNRLGYEINYISSHDELVEFISLYSNYKNYQLPVIIADISFFSKKDQSILLKFLDDTSLKIILLASRDNILETIISRVKEYRKYYISKDSSGINFFKLSKARSLLNDELEDNKNSLSSDDFNLLCCKYNSALAYNEYLTSACSANEKNKILSLLEYSDE